MKIIPLATLIFIYSDLKAQNLVPNPSFEDLIDCPDTASNNFYGNLIENAQGWISMRGSPNYFNSCVDDSSLFDVPSNGFGYQDAASGNAYGGFYTYGIVGGGSENLREFVGTHLLQPLSIGQTYYVTFKISWATDGYYFVINWATNQTGAFFSTVPIFSLTDDPLYNFAHVYESSVITDSSNWVEVSGSFIADSAYQYVMFGNFFDTAHTTAILYGPFPSLGAYYFIDDVCVTGVKENCENWNSISLIEQNAEIQIFPNPADDKIIVKIPEDEIQSIIIFNTLGIVVAERSDKEIQPKEEFDTKEFKNGMYWCEILTSKKSVIKSFIILH